MLPTSPCDQFSSTANYSPRRTAGSNFNSTLGYTQGSVMAESPSYSMDNSPRDTQHQVSLSNQTAKHIKSSTVATVGNASNFSPPVQTTASIQVASRNSPGKEETLRLEEAQRKEAEENQLRLQKEQEEKARAAEEKRLEEERKKQQLLAKLREIDESQSTALQAETKPTSHMEDTQSVKKKRLEDIFNDEASKDHDEMVVRSTAKPFPSRSNSLEERHKKELLAQLLSTDQPTTQANTTRLIDEVLTTASSHTSIKSSTSSIGSNYKWNTRIENMHQGKPAMASTDDPFGRRASGSLHKGNNIMDGSTNGRVPQRKQSDGGLDFLAGTGGVINTDAYHTKKKDIPTFGRRAVFGSDLKTETPTLSLSKETVSTNNSSTRSYPWEQEVNITSEHNILDYLSHNTTSVDSSLLPRRIKAQPLNINTIPGQIDDDIEELSLV